MTLTHRRAVLSGKREPIQSIMTHTVSSPGPPGGSLFLRRRDGRALARAGVAAERRHRGQVTAWKNDQGFGFIAPDRGGEAVFAHVSAFADQTRRPRKGDVVSYDLTTGPKGRPRAANVRLEPGRQPLGAAASGLARDDADSPQPAWRTAPLATVFGLFLPVILAMADLTLVGVLTWEGRLPLWVPWLTVVASLVSFAAYGLDKAAAQADLWRVRERGLHILALAGGWPGALLAQALLRHKTRKRAFQRAFRATVCLNAAALAWISMVDGSALAGALAAMLRLWSG